MDSPRDDHDGLPPGCTVVDRTPFPSLAVSATSGLVSDADADKTLASETGGIVGGGSVVLTSAGKRPPASSAPQPQGRANVEHGKPKKARASTEVFRKHHHLDRTVEAPLAHHWASAKSRPPPVPSKTREVRYSPGPTFRKARGRKKKALLDPSEVTKNRVIGVKELNALLRDLALQQVNKDTDAKLL